MRGTRISRFGSRAALAVLAVLLLGALAAAGCGVGPEVGGDRTTITSGPGEKSTTTATELTTTTTELTTTTGVPLTPAAQVTEVVDVDTVRAVIGGESETVRLLNVMPPPPGSPVREQGKQKLADMVEGRSVELEFGDRKRDDTGRLLAYLFLDGKMVNSELLRLGYARTVDGTGPDEVYRALQEAVENRRGMWARGTGGPTTTLPGTGSSPDRSGLPFEVSWHSPQGPSGALNDEWLKIKATVATNLKGYAVQNLRGEFYVFPNLPLAPGGTVRLHSGAGTPSTSDLYWGASALMWNVPLPSGGIGGALSVFDPEGYLLHDEGWQGIE